MLIPVDLSESEGPPRQQEESEGEPMDPRAPQRSEEAKDANIGTQSSKGAKRPKRKEPQRVFICVSSLENSAPDPSTTTAQGISDKLARQMTNGKNVTSAP